MLLLSNVMNIGSIVEFIDQQKLICAAVIQEKKQKLRLLTENNREVNLSAGRALHISSTGLDMSERRDVLVKNLKQIARDRQKLALEIDTRELWELLHEEGDSIDLATMTLFCFDPPLADNHEAAVIRAFFHDRLYFKFGKESFAPLSPEQLELRLQQQQEAEKQERLLKEGTDWVRAMLDTDQEMPPRPSADIITILCNYYVQDRESSTASIAKSILTSGGADSGEQIFNIMVAAGIWDIHQNIDLIRFDIPEAFPETVLRDVDRIVESAADFRNDPLRRDLTHLPIITIDGQSTLDYDDAISLEKEDDGYIIGVHIIDVGYYIKNNDPIDRHARTRGSSIYMPDDKIPMLPPNLSEDLCSLKQGETRPGISTLVKLNRFFEIIDFEVIPSIIKVHEQMTYTEANLHNGENDPITTLYRAATILREKRLKSGAVQITLPEVNVWIEDNGDIGISRIDRENPSRMLVSELMILANSLMADFLAEHKVPGVFRSQPDPKKRLFQGLETSLFMNCMQRKQLSRAIIGPRPEHHSGLGVKAYVTATSPIRRYYDLVTQRQIRGILGYEKPYSLGELESLLQVLAEPVANTNRVQFQRKKYWLLRYLETMKGKTCEAIVLDVRRDFCTVLLTEYMLEWRISASGLGLKPGDLLQLTIQHADARRDQLSLFAS